MVREGFYSGAFYFVTLFISLATFVDSICPSVKYIVKGSIASVYQFGGGREFCYVTIRTDPRLRISLYAEFFNTGLFGQFLLILSPQVCSFFAQYG